MAQFDLTDLAVRQVLVKEFMAGLRRIGGASTSDEMVANRLTLYKVPANAEDVDELAEAARRLGYVEPQEWRENEPVVHTVTSRGFELPPPSSLDAPRILASLLRVGPGARKQVTDWFPALVAIVGALAAFSDNESAQSLAIRWLTIAILTAVILKHVHDEWLLHQGTQAWVRLRDAKRGTPEWTVMRFYALPRIACSVVIALTLVVLYACLILPGKWPQWDPGAVLGLRASATEAWLYAAVVAAVLALGVILWWMKPLRSAHERMRREA